MTYSKAALEKIEIGSEMENCFGQDKKVVRIIHRGFDSAGRYFLGVYLQFGPTSSMSHWYKEGEPNRLV